jgi:hypothetical protein
MACGEILAGLLHKVQKCVHPFHVAYVNNQWTLFAEVPSVDLPHQWSGIVPAAS